MKKLELHWQILIAMVLAIPAGLLLKENVGYVSWVGEVFLRALKMLVIPLIITSIISGIVNIGEGENLGRLGFKTILYYIATSSLAILVGLGFVNVIKPGTNMDINIDQTLDTLDVQQKNLSETLIEIVPDNIFAALTNNDLLSVIFFAIVMGIFITKISRSHRKTLTNLINSFFELFMKITLFVIKLAPIGIFGLIAQVVADQEDFFGLLLNLGSFILTVLGAILFHSFVILPLILFVFGRNNPLKHFQNMSTALLTAFSTASSAAVLPLTMDSVKNKSGVSDKITNFTLPIGTTVNMDGTAIYICSVVMFIAQGQGLNMGIKEQFIILLTGLLASIGTAAIPMASLVVITIILDVFQLPFALVALVLPVDRILDMFRTATNVWSDSCGAVVIAKSEGEKLNV
ncbi:MAG: dicarboxylate/amino acid:cation symporter [Bacteroidota bacterium]